MAIADRKWSALPVPSRDGVPGPGSQGALLRPGLLRDGSRAAVAAGLADGVPARGDPAPHDFVEYEFLDQSIIVLRTDDMGVRAFQNACRHRGVKVVEGSGTCENGFTCPFHGWCYGPDGTNTAVPRRKTFSEHNLQPDDINLVPVRCEVWGGCAWINLDDDAPPLRQCIEPAASMLDAWKVESLRTEKWYACRLPVNWKLADRGVRRDVPRGADASPARHPRRGTGCATVRRSTRVRSSMRTSSTCAR